MGVCLNKKYMQKKFKTMHGIYYAYNINKTTIERMIEHEICQRSDAE